MPELPTQVPWRRFVCVLRKLGYTAQKGKAGSARAFMNPNRMPNVISLREPHPGQEPRAQQCCESIFSKLLLNQDEFMQLLKDC